MLYIVIACVIGIVYIAWRTDRIEGIIRTLVAKQDEVEQTKSVHAPAPASFLPYEWTDYPWSRKSKEEERRTLQNPNVLESPDEFVRGQMLQRFKGLADPLDRIAFLQALLSHGVYFDEIVTSEIIRDESPIVRSWGAANLVLEFRDYRNHTLGEGEAPLIADYTDELMKDLDPIVAASLWTNPEFKRLPWSMIWLNQSWKQEFKGMAPLARVALMHNRRLWPKYVVALMDADSADLGISRDEHAQLLFTVSKNSHLCLDSRLHGRDYWTIEGDANPPDEEYGRMWEIAVDKWMDKMYVVYSILRYIQTTGKVKVGIYKKLLEVADNHGAQFRETITDGCDVFRDKEVLKLAWSDPNEKCRQAAHEVIGNLRSIVGVK